MNSMSGEKLKGIPYTGTLPATLTGTKAGYLHRYKIYGNLEQTGTPTPENPIVPQECGERTENLCYRIITNATIDGNGRIVYDSSFDVAVAPVYQDSSYSALNPSNVYAWFMTEPYLGSQSYNQSRNAETLINKPSPLNGFVAVRYTKANSSNAMVIKGSTVPTSYTPYGYKLPLTSAGQNVDVYLGESQTTRRIKKLVFNGTENWGIDSGRFTIILNDIKTQGLRLTEFYCSSYQVISDGRAYADVPNNAIYTGGGSSTGVNVYVYIHTDAYTDTTSFKAYLAQQYANGTPVTVWYPLVTPTTGILNEPLRKIGDYADTIDSTQTTAQIPTSANSTTVSWAGEGLAPSEFDSIQEWVDIPTYTYTNGEWVADN